MRLDPAVAADAAAVTEIVAALESSLNGEATFTQADLEEWSEIDLSLGYNAVRVFRELRIELDAPPHPEWPDGLRVVPFDPGARRARVLRRAPGGVRGSQGLHAARLRVVVEELHHRARRRRRERHRRLPPLRASRDDARALGWVAYEKELSDAA